MPSGFIVVVQNKKRRNIVNILLFLILAATDMPVLFLNFMKTESSLLARKTAHIATTTLQPQKIVATVWPTAVFVLKKIFPVHLTNFMPELRKNVPKTRKSPNIWKWNESDNLLFQRITQAFHPTYIFKRAIPFL